MNENQINDGGPAFPTPIAGCNDGGVYPATQITPNGGGMSLRDWFAGKAMQGILACSAISAPIPNGNPWEKQGVGYNDWVAGCAYSIADAMLRARETGR